MHTTSIRHRTLQSDCITVILYTLSVKINLSNCSCHTDISMATNCGMRSLLVLTGVSTLADVGAYKASGDPTQATYVPTYYASRLGQLGKLLGLSI